MSDINNIKVEPHLNISLGIGKKDKGKTVGILNKGSDNKFINNTFDRLDIGIEDHGKNTTAKDNKFR